MSQIKIIKKDNVLIYASNLKNLSNDAIKIQKTTPLASLALATSIVVFSPLSAMKKYGKTSVFYSFNGPLKNIVLETNVNGDVRALIGNPNVSTDFDNVDPNQIPLRVGLGEKGTLRITSEFNGNNFGGEVEMANGDIVSDLAYYFDQSDQINSAIVSHVELDENKKIKRAESIIFKIYPSNDEQKEKDIQWISNFIKKHKISQMTFEEYIEKIEGKVIDEIKMRWKCKCSEEKTKSIIKLLSNEEKKKIINEFGKLEIMCNFCNKKYEWKENE